LSGPRVCGGKDFVGRERGDVVAADVVELDEVEERAGGAKLFEAEGKFFVRFLWIGAAPVLKAGVGEI